MNTRSAPTGSVGARGRPGRSDHRLGRAAAVGAGRLAANGAEWTGDRQGGRTAVAGSSARQHVRISLNPPQEVASAAPDSLQGRRFHIVRSGESLWSIATALLPAGTDNAEIAGAVHRLWRLNESTIGTGDPNLIYAGTVLELTFEGPRGG